MAYSVIKKGKLPLCQDNLISLNQYLLVNENGRQFLLFKFINNSGQRVEAVKLTVKQKDTGGASLETLNIEYMGIGAEDGAQFAIDNKIAVSDYFWDFTAAIIAADFGRGYEPNTRKRILPQQEQDAKKQDKNTPRINISGGENKAVSTRKFKTSAAACFIILVIFALSAFITYGHLYITKANSETFFYKGIEYAFENGDKSPNSPVYAVGCKSSVKHIVIEESLKGRPVTRIAKHSFSGKLNIEKLTVKGAISIEANAFESCINLSEINLGKTSVIGEQAFAQCESLKEVSASNLKTIGENAFNNCINLKSVKISNNKSVLSIGTNAFSRCNSLAEIDIDQYIDYPEDSRLFLNCNNVKSLRLKNFNYSFTLNGTDYPDTKDKTILSLFGVTSWLSEFKQFNSLVIDYCDGIPRNFGYSIPLESVTIKNGDITEVGNNAFANCSNLKNLDLPSPLMRVGNYSFFGTALTEFNCSVLAYIGNSAFESCQKLAAFDLRGNSALSYIGAGAFSGCTALTSIVIPPQITQISTSVFESCNSLSDVVFNAEIESIGSNAFKGCASLQALDLPQGLRFIGEMTFEGTALESVIIPSTVTDIGYGAFYNCNSLKEITVPFVGGSISANSFLCFIFGGQNFGFDFDTVPKSLQKVTVTSVTRIASNAFYGCQYIKEIVIESNLTSIGISAFAGCRSLNRFVIPASVTTIETDAFEGCYKLFELYNLSKLNITRSASTFGMAGYYALKIYKALDQQRITMVESDGYEFMQDDQNEWHLTDFDQAKTDLNFPDGVPYTQNSYYNIVKYLTPDNDKITSVYMPWLGNYVGEYAFSNCAGITFVTVGGDIGEYAFSDCTGITSVTVNGNIGDYAFSNCTRITSVQSTRAVSGFAAFYNCHLIEEMTLPYISGLLGEESIRYLGYIFGAEYFYESGNYVSYSLKKVTLTELSAPVEDYAFYNCYNIETIILQNHITSIGNSAFNGCSALTNFDLPSNLISIGEQAFQYCSSLKEIRLPSSLQTVGRSAFYGCIGLECVEVMGNTAFGDDVFYGCYYLYEVKNHRVGLNLQIGSRDNGHIAYYALVVHNAASRVVIQDAVINGMVFKYYGDIWALTDYTGTAASLNLTGMTYQGNIISSYTVRPYAFSRKTYPSVLTISSAVYYLYESAFEDFYGLKSASLENSTLKVLNNNTFAYCHSLTSVTLPQSLTNIGDSVFSNCSQLTSIRIPQNVVEIGNGAFWGCYALCDVYNFSQLIFEEGDYNNGCVAYYALRINTTAVAPLPTTVSGEFKFVLFESVWYLISIEEYDSTVVTLPKSFIHNGVTVTSYVLLESAFADKYCHSVFIPKAVSKIQRLNGNSCYIQIDSIDYEGTSQEWNQLLTYATDSPFKKSTVNYEENQ